MTLLVTDIQRISTDAAGNQGNGASYQPAFFPDGKKVAFEGASSNLVAGDTNGSIDIFVVTLAEVLTGTPGNDTLTGGAGDDTLYGGSGADTYFFSGAHGRDTVGDGDGAANDNLRLRAPTARVC
jgi:Ca2+-binding RTX toxin-like protein